MPTSDPTQTIHLPDGRIATVPLSVLEQYEVVEAHDVTAHLMSVDQNTGQSDWHTDYELGDCFAADPLSGEMRDFFQVWHQHPFGTDYAELYAG